MQRNLRISVLAFLISYGLCAVSASSHAQAVPVKSAAPRHQPSLPSWITMMDDPHVNYYDAVKAFNDYWKDKVTPKGEDEMDEADSTKNRSREAEEKEERRRRLTKDDPAVKYVYEYKRFLHWQQEMEPFVQPDGHIKGMDTRIKEWKEQKALKEKQEREQGSGMKRRPPDSPAKKN